MGPRARLLLLTLAAIATDCVASPPDDGDEPTITAHLPVTCNPQLDRYPIAGPHNGGYDRAWSNFTCPAHPSGSPDNSDYGGDHHGNDLFAARGTPVVAVRAGRVTRAGVASSISGNRVTIEDDCGWSYYFGHLDSIAGGVAVGARVTAGQVIGTVGNTGATGTAPHVHFNVHRDGNYNNDVDPFPLLQAADRTACDPTTGGGGGGGGGQCAPRCEGDTLVDNACGRGNCASYGSRCVSDNLGSRCVFFACRPDGEHDTCWLGRYIGHCRNGALLTQGDCGQYGARCVSDDLGTRCAFFACRDRGTHGTCWLGRYIGQCRDGALSEQGDCGQYGANCVQEGDRARCVFFACRPQGEHDTCFLGRFHGRCRDGALIAQSECPDGASVCDDLGRRCVTPECRATRGPSSVCAANGRIMQCTNGTPTGLVDCPAMGARCAQIDATTARCVRPTDPPPPPFDAGPPPVVDAAVPDVGFALPDAWIPIGEDGGITEFDVLATADVPPAADVLYPPDAGGYFVPDGGMMRAEVESFTPPGYDDGEDPCAVCRPLGRCPPQCKGVGGADGGGQTVDVSGPGCSCRAAGGGAAGRGAWGLAMVIALAQRRRRRVP